ncbi:MAG TPA: hypothetical protein VNH65_05190 [Candidatus Acidoferrum sp.]|nr:hypothetical protein [Candidatus Acidoferrum sp.]
MTQPQRVPDVESQRAAMKKLSFLIGRWAGEARILRSPRETVELNQTEEARYKLDGLILTIEGIGRSKADGKTTLQALGLVSYNDHSGKYIMRAFNDGRYLETELRLADDGQGIMWGFAHGEIKTSSVLRINEEGEWTELTEITIGAEPPRKFMELRVSRQK